MTLALVYNHARVYKKYPWSNTNSREKQQGAGRTRFSLRLETRNGPMASEAATNWPSSKLCKRHRFEGSQQHRLRRFKRFRDEYLTFVNQSELDFYRETARHIHFLPKEHKIHVVWDFCYGRDIRNKKLCPTVKSNRGYALVTLKNSDLPDAYWVTWNPHVFAALNASYVLTKVNIPVWDCSNHQLITKVEYSRLPDSEFICAFCLMEKYKF